MKAKLFLNVLVLIFCQTSFSSSFSGEKEILFEAKNGESSVAFEGSIMVPENRSNKNSRMIPIKYVRFPATGNKQKSPIIYLSGGPGGSGIQTAKYWRFPLFMAMREFGDVIALDQRGTGASDVNPECKSSFTIDHTKYMSDKKHVSIHNKALKECLRFWKTQGVDIFGYTTPENVNDLEALRLHLKADKVILWGISYGSHMALAALKTMGKKIDKVIIASAEGLDQTIKMPKRTDAYFDRLQLAINKQKQSKEMFGDIKALMKRVHTKLDENPIELAVLSEDGVSYPYLLQRRDLQEFASASISDPTRAKRLLQLYLAIDNDITEPVIAVLQKFYKPNKSISYKAMSIAMDLASGMGKKRKKEIKKQAKTALLKDYLNFTYHLTDTLLSIDLGDQFRRAPHSSVPTLLLTGTLDGRTYIKSQLEAVAGLTNLTAITVNNAGHNLFMFSAKQPSPDVLDVMKKFMRGDEIKKKEVTVPLPDFSK